MSDVLKAYAVQETCEGTGGIVFAKYAIVARRKGAGIFGDGDFHSVTCQRAKWADQYAELDVLPAKVMIANGWHFECSGCGATIDEDWLWDNDRELHDVIGTQHSMVFCGPVCEARHNLYQAEATYIQKRMIRRFTRIIKRKFPDAEIVNEPSQLTPHAYSVKRWGKWRVEQVSVAFTFPGMTYGAARLEYRRDRYGGRQDRLGRPNRPYWTCPNGDQLAFQAFVEDQAEKTKGASHG